MECEGRATGRTVVEEAHGVMRPSTARNAIPGAARAPEGPAVQTRPDRPHGACDTA